MKPSVVRGYLAAAFEAIRVYTEVFGEEACCTLKDFQDYPKVLFAWGSLSYAIHLNPDRTFDYFDSLHLDAQGLKDKLQQTRTVRLERLARVKRREAM